ncbi:DNA-binding MarR family transcriptional regulator [Bacillus thermophilus]|uniref:DNA-binding MarR family transcriptional regulator n=1 Tax=Siminovitchia thermophila TaxID=1245522 RepID=A0ABS2R8U5_9BACI|nr:MarR family transcriptional regulator [Siminovitchia thermophila]MBM7716076.1 DNA-binding MarR family transcriptional regulator [Siminovitchia thermophila]ONK24936.1 MarR family transcriptional regulator [Bacillus sp. VT-16-64]
MLNEYIRHVKELHQAEENCNLAIVNEYRPLMKYDLTSKQEMLLKLVRKYNVLTVSELAKHMKVTSSAVSQIMSKLEKDHYIKRSINPANRREIIVSLAQKGKEYFAERDHIEIKIIQKYYSKLSLEEIITLKNITIKLEKLMSGN